MPNPTIQFDRVKLQQLKAAYNEAKKENRNIFIFEKSEILVDYAKYLIEYLENRFENLQNK